MNDLFKIQIGNVNMTFGSIFVSYNFPIKWGSITSQSSHIAVTQHGFAGQKKLFDFAQLMRLFDCSVFFVFLLFLFLNVNVRVPVAYEGGFFSKIVICMFSRYILFNLKSAVSNIQ